MVVVGGRMILNVSGRCDIPAFYSKWFFKRMEAGFVDVRNPFYPKQISRIILDREHIDAIVFCTKNPIPMLSSLEKLKDYPLLFQITITPYGKEIEPYVPPKGRVVKAIKKYSKILGRNHVIIRYDPIFLSQKYNMTYHEKQFEKLCSLLEGDIDRVIISFIDLKKNTLKNAKEIDLEPFTTESIEKLAESFGRISKKHGMQIQTCAEDYDLEKFGFLKEGCISTNILEEILGVKKKIPKNHNRENCLCVQTVDIGVYNTCPHFCKYCYANFKEEEVIANFKKHDVNSSLLIGTLEKDDMIKVRK